MTNATPEPDADIRAHLKSGNTEAAFALLMPRYQARIYRLCLTYLRHPAQAHDAAQESLIRIWRTLPRYDDRAALSTLIYVITRNRCLTALAKKPAPLSLSEPALQAEIDRQQAPSLQANRDLTQTIRHLVEQLPDTTRRIVTLYYFEEGSIAQVSTQLGLPEGTIKTHLHRARRQLAASLIAQGLFTQAAWHP